MRKFIASFALFVSMLCGASLWATNAETLTPKEHLRTPDQTFLTFPEWYLVHSPAEYAAYLTRGGRPSAFPLFAHIGQFWCSYAAINHEIAKYAFNGGYHVMVMVIGVSTTVEYGLKGIYEHTIGRLAEATRSKDAIPEEQFAARYAQSYVDFIRVDPWYLYDFWSPLKTLWQDVPVSGPNLIRRWERRFVLTSELLVKEGYARLIKLGTQSVYDAPEPVTAVVLSAAPKADARHADYKALSSAPDGDIVATIPRYEAFTAYSRWLAQQGIAFREIAGNRGDVVVSVLVPTAWKRSAEARTLFEQPIITQPGRKRVVFAVPVAQLSAVLRQADAAGEPVQVEHVYDF